MQRLQDNYLNIVLISGSGIIAGIINYLYQPIMIRYLTLTEFGEFASLMGIFNILGVFILGITLFLNKEISKNKTNKEKNLSLYKGSMKILFFVGIIFYLLYIFLSPLIGGFLRIDTSFIIIAGIVIIVSCIGASNDSLLRGVQSFRFMSFLGIFGAFTKLIIGTLLVVLGTHTYGAIGGVIASSFLGFALSYWYITKIFKGVSYTPSLSEIKINLFTQKREVINFILVSFFFAFFMNIDILLAKNIFDETTIGIYAGISVLGKFLIFLLLSIETVYYSQIMELPRQQIKVHLIKNPLILIFITSIGALIINFFIGDFLLGLLKPELAGNLWLYLMILGYYFLLALISFLSKVLVGWGVYSVNKILGGFALVLIISVYSFGRVDMQNFIAVFIALGTMRANVKKVC